MMKGIITQRKALELLREEAGLSIKSAKREIERLPKIADGERQKVKLADIRKLIIEANKPSPVIIPKVKISPFQKRLAARIIAERV